MLAILHRRPPLGGDTAVPRSARTLRVNDRRHTVNLDPRESLLDVLREGLDLTGTTQ
jgi:hypothetical protein